MSALLRGYHVCIIHARRLRVVVRVRCPRSCCPVITIATRGIIMCAIVAPFRRGMCTVLHQGTDTPFLKGSGLLMRTDKACTAAEILACVQVVDHTMADGFCVADSVLLLAQESCMLWIR